MSQRFSSEGLKAVGWTAFLKVVVTSIISTYLVDEHLYYNEVDEEYGYFATSSYGTGLFGGHPMLRDDYVDPYADESFCDWWIA